MEQQEEQRGIMPLASSTAEKAKYFTTVALGATGVTELLGFGWYGLLAGAAVGGAAAYFSEEIRDGIVSKLPAPKQANTKTSKLSWWITGQEPQGSRKAIESEPASQDEAADEGDIYHANDVPEQEQTEARRTMTAYELLASGTLGNDIMLGYDRDGNEIRRSWKQLKAILILGLQGGGKTSTATWLMAQALTQGARLAVIDKHAKSEEDSMLQKIEPFMSFFDCNPGEDPQSALQVAAHVKCVFEARLDGAPCDYPLLLVVDEFSAIMKHLKEDGSKWQEVAKALASLIENLNEEGRKHKVYAVCIGQATNASRTGGTEVRDLFNTRIVHGMREKQAQMLSLNEYAKAIRLLDQGQVIVDMEGRDEPFFVQVPYLSDKDIKAIAGRIGTPRRAVPNSENLETLLASNNLSVDDLLKALLTETMGRPDVDPEDRRYAQPREQVAQHYYQPVQQTPWPMFERMPDLSPKTPAQPVQQPQRPQYERMPDLPPAQHRPSPALPRELQQALDAYEPGMSYRDLAKAMGGIGKDTAGRYIQELKRRGLI